MSEIVANTDLVKLMLSSSPTLVSVTVVILAHFLSEFAKVHDLGEKERRPYFISAILMASTTFLGFVETMLSLTYLASADPSSNLLTFQAIVTLFILMMIGIMSGAIFLLIKVLK